MSFITSLRVIKQTLYVY